MAQAAKRLRLEYIAITDHSRRLRVAHGLNEEMLKKQKEEIKKANQIMNNSRIKILRGVEINILKDGRLDLAAVHSYFSLPKKDQTKRLISAMYNPNVDILFHPNSRII